MAEAGGNTFIFQWEAVQNERNSMQVALTIAESVADHGMDCGISINPSTSVDEIFELLKSGLIAAVDVLSVEPGFGGQRFQDVAEKKVHQLHQFREEHHDVDFLIMVDGGINDKTATLVRSADVLVAGTFLFQHPQSLQQGVEELTTACLDIQDRSS